MEGYYVLRDSTFQAAAEGVNARRQDDGESFQVRLKAGFLTRGSVSVFYQHRKNDSSDPLYDFSGNQWGIELDYSY